MTQKKRLLLIITGSIAAYKSLDLIRRAREAGWAVTPVLTQGAQAFITPLAAAALAESPAYTDLFSLKDEAEMGHIRLAREADAVLVAPASADLMAKMAHGLADDLASTLLMATRAPVFVAPAMNVAMWQHAATQRNLAQLKADGVRVIAPGEGLMACGEVGEGRLAEIVDILAVVERETSVRASGPTLSPALPPQGGGSYAAAGVVSQASPVQGGRNSAEAAASSQASPPQGARSVPSPLRGEGQGGGGAAGLTLSGTHAIVTAGPTQEPLDPVRYLSNHSSGKQGYAIAAELQRLGARVTLISGPTALTPPVGVEFVLVRTAEDMLKACEAALPADIFIGVAAVADWKVAKPLAQKIKKRADGSVPQLKLEANPDILQRISIHPKHRPALVIGFGAETHALEAYARGKLLAKGCDWLVATNAAEGRVFGADITDIVLFKRTAPGARAGEAPSLERLGTLPKIELARRLGADILAWRMAEKASTPMTGKKKKAM